MSIRISVLDDEPDILCPVELYMRVDYNITKSFSPASSRPG